LIKDIFIFIKTIADDPLAWVPRRAWPEERGSRCKLACNLMPSAKGASPSVEHKFLAGKFDAGLNENKNIFYVINEDH